MDIEEAFQVTGRMGRYQVLLTVIGYFSNLLYGSQLLLMVIVGATPNKDVPSERNLSTIVTEWDLYNDQWVISLLGSLFLAGFIAGAFVFGQLPDLYGRKPIYVINGTLSSVSCFCSAFCQNWHTFALTRFFGGFFAGGAAAPSFVLMCELVGKDVWGSVGMLYQLFFSAGIILIGLLGYLFKNWRDVVMVASGLSALVLPVIIIIVPESPRWLFSVGKIEKAEAVMKHIAKKNGKDDTLIKLEIPVENKTVATNFHKYSLLGLLRIEVLAKLLAAVTYVWFACSLSYYGLTVDISSLMPNIYLGTILSGAVEMPAYIITVFLLDSKWFGRRGTMMFLLLTSSITSTCILFTGGMGQLTIVKTVLGLISKLSIAAAFSVMFIYISELFPTQIRAVALVVGNTAARVGAIIAFFVPLLGNIAFFLPYAIFGAGTVLSGVLVLSFPETLGKRPFVMTDFASSECYETDQSDRRTDALSATDAEPLVA